MTSYFKDIHTKKEIGKVVITLILRPDNIELVDTDIVLLSDHKTNLHFEEKLEEKYDIVMDVETERRVNTMCNLSEVVLERGMQQGIEQGIEKKLIDLVCKKINKGYNLEQIADLLEEDITVIQPIYDLALEQKPDYNVDLILRAIQS